MKLCEADPVGLCDTWRQSVSKRNELDRRQRTEIVTVRQLREEIAACQQLLAGPASDSLALWASLLESLRRHGAVIEDIVDALAQEHGQETYEELRWWARALARQVRSFESDLRKFTPVVHFPLLTRILQQKSRQKPLTVVVDHRGP